VHTFSSGHILSHGERIPKDKEFLFLEQAAHSFLTCYSIPVISVKFFVTPFETWVWGCFVLSLTAVMILWIKISQAYCGAEKSKPFSLLFLMISSVTEDCVGIPNGLSQILAFRCSFVAWSLATIVLVNGYIGVLITGLTTRFDAKSISRFSELSLPHYKYKETSEKLLWCNMACKEPLSYFYEDQCESEETGVTVRKLVEVHDFRLLSSALVCMYVLYGVDSLPIKVTASPSSALTYLDDNMLGTLQVPGKFIIINLRQLCGQFVFLSRCKIL